MLVPNAGRNSSESREVGILVTLAWYPSCLADSFFVGSISFVLCGFMRLVTRVFRQGAMVFYGVFAPLALLTVTYRTIYSVLLHFWEPMGARSCLSLEGTSQCHRKS